MFLSDVRIWFPMYGVIMGMMIYRLGWKKGLVVILSCILCVILADQISYHIKEGIDRLRAEPLQFLRLLLRPRQQLLRIRHLFIPGVPAQRPLAQLYGLWLVHLRLGGARLPEPRHDGGPFLR